ncbi:DNA-directed RNA polymerase subunit beta'-like isoform X2 [Mya arenaria]|uniref:DNA-directed RNA polymerase subunit beta'-like isoform X2 n=1 Tax=Mya arenaria TaxID=6604 RepID=UPI0022E1EA40|nr:DNA-directed RNA polymerase subunit beta'-like isoform X2 [Mya arenaria]
MRMAAAMAPGSVDVNTQNEQHYLRLHLLVMKAGDVLRAKFDSIATPNNLLNELKKHKRVIDKLQKNDIITSDQYRLIHPNPDSKMFDVSLLIVLLRNLCNLQPLHPIWKEKDNNKIFKNMHPEIANIVRIRNLRNKMQHKHVASLDQKEFEDDWSLLESSMVVLGQSCGLNSVKADIEDLKKKSLGQVPPEIESLREKTIWLYKECCDCKFNDENFYDDYGADDNYDEDVMDDRDYADFEDLNEGCDDELSVENNNDDYDANDNYNDDVEDDRDYADFEDLNAGCEDELSVENNNDDYDANDNCNEDVVDDRDYADFEDLNAGCEDE